MKNSASRLRRAIVLAPSIALLLLAAPAVADEFHSCLNGLRGAASAKGVSSGTFDSATANLQPDMKVL